MINGYIPAARFLPFLSWTDVAALPDKSNTVIVLPTGAIEQHGPHLPCSVDSVISSGVAGHALARLPATIPAYAIPPIVYGKSEEHLHFPGTLTLSGDTLLHTLLEIAESLYRAGFRKLLMINGHGGQPQILQIACREMRLRHGDFIAIPHDVFNVPNCEKQFLSPHEQRMAMHAGHSETALMLALAPECVHMERAVANFPPEFPCPTLSKGRPAAAWASYDFGPSGVIGDPTPATREQGEGLLDSLAASWAQAIIEIHRMAWVERREPTWGYPPYGNSIICMADTIRKRPAAVAAFVKASMEGWKSYLRDPAPGNNLIGKANPQMGAEQIAFGIAQMKQYQLVTGGDAKTGGIGIITEPRLKKTWDMLVKNKLIDASKVPFEQTYTLEMVKDAGVMP